MFSEFTSNEISMFLDRAAGMFYGIAIGDALGVPHEFSRAKPKIPYTGIINTEHIITVQFQFAKMTLPPATSSDDTAMTLALLEALLERKLCYDEETVCVAYWRFANSIKTGLGKNTRKLFKFKCQEKNAYKGYLRRYNKGVEDNSLLECQSNGSLMRAAPLIFACKGVDSANQDYALTNPNLVNDHCSQIYTTLLRAIYLGKNKSELKQLLEWLVSSSELVDVPEVKQAVIEALEGKYERDIGGQDKGWVCHCLYAALCGFFNFDTMGAAMEWLVRIPNSDTDTNASVCGGLWGAFLGESGMLIEDDMLENIGIIKKITPAGKKLGELLEQLREAIKEQIQIGDLFRINDIYGPDRYRNTSKMMLSIDNVFKCEIIRVYFSCIGSGI